MRRLDREGIILPIKWLVVVIILVFIWYTSQGQGVNPYIAFLIGIGILYNLAISLLLFRGSLPRNIDRISAVVHGILTILGIMATGSLESPFLPLLTLTLMAFATRFPVQKAIPIGIGSVLALAIGILATSADIDVMRLSLLVLFNILALLMTNNLVRRNELYRVQVLRVTSHELRNPMTIVKGNCALIRLMLEKGIMPKDAVDRLKVIEREIDHLTSLLDQLPIALKAQDGRKSEKYEKVNLTRLVDTTLQTFRSANLPHDIVVQNLDQNELWVNGDSIKLEEVLKNLVSNAVKYSPNGGHIVVELRPVGCEALLSVRDEGVGIPEGQLNKVFECFYRSSSLPERDPGGMGLGLYISKTIIEQHSGQIWIESAKGEGTTAFVRLPLSCG